MFGKMPQWTNPGKCSKKQIKKKVHLDLFKVSTRAAILTRINLIILSGSVLYVWGSNAIVNY